MHHPDLPHGCKPERHVDNGQFFQDDLQSQAGSLHHLGQIADQPETGNVRTGMNRVFPYHRGGSPVQGRHDGRYFPGDLPRGQVAFYGRVDDSRTQGLGEHQTVPHV